MGSKQGKSPACSELVKKVLRIGRQSTSEPRRVQTQASTVGRRRSPSARGTHVARDLRFVIQRHAARRLHYDFRLERNGALASWAVPKGVPLRQGERHLAVHVEDHPLEYADFEGTIPAGEYGAGTVEIWDRGTYELLEEKRDGGLTVRLRGERLDGDVDARAGAARRRPEELAPPAQGRGRAAAAATRRCSRLRRSRSRSGRSGCTSRSGTASARS